MLELDIETLSLSVDKAIPSGLILNELITNALKHAFPAGRKGAVHVELRTISEGRRMRLSVGDNGIGLAPTFSPSGSASLGMGLVSTLVDQLEGELEIIRGAGTVFQVTFPVEPSAASDAQTATSRNLFQSLFPIGREN